MLPRPGEASTRIARYAYDADNSRVQKVAGPDTTFDVRGPNNELLTEWKNPGGTSPSFRDCIYAGSRLLAVVKQQ